MSCPSRKDRIALWKYSHARSAFVQAQAACDLLLTSEAPQGSTVRVALTVAMIASYTRPFKERPATRLDRKMVPEEFREQHEELIILRDKLVVHRDMNVTLAEWGQSTPVVFTVSADGRVEYNTVSPDLLPETVKRVKIATEELLDRVIKEQKAVLGRMEPHWRKLGPGTYMLSLEESPAAWLIAKPFQRVAGDVLRSCRQETDKCGPLTGLPF